MWTDKDKEIVEFLVNKLYKKRGVTYAMIVKNPLICYRFSWAKKEEEEFLKFAKDYIRTKRSINAAARKKLIEGIILGYAPKYEET